MSKILKKFQFTLIAILSTFIVITLIFFNGIEPADELWVFQNLTKMNNGFLIYRDANVITTPLFFYIGALLLKIFGNSFFIFRIFCIVLYGCIFLLVYKIFKNLNFSSHLALIGVSLVFLQIFSIITAGASYNTLVLLFVLIGINLYITQNNNIFLHGLIIFLIFFTKQNMGVFYFLAIIFCDFYKEKFSKKFFIDLFKKIAIFLFLSIPFLLNFYFSNTLVDFLDYAFGSLLEFQDKNLVFTASFYLFLIVITPFLLYFIILKLKNNKSNQIITQEIFNNFTILIIFTFFITFYIYPIINDAHILFAIPIHLIFILYFFDVLILEDFFADSKYVSNINWIVFFILLAIFIRIISNYFEISQTYSFITEKSSPFYGFMINDNNIKKASIVKSYIQEKNSKSIDVIIFSSDSAFVMVELKQSHGPYDLLFNGNLGFDGINKIKKDILNRKNTEFLIVTNESDMFAQEPAEIRDFIIENLEFQGTIENYSIYSNY